MHNFLYQYKLLNWVQSNYANKKVVIKNISDHAWLTSSSLCDKHETLSLGFSFGKKEARIIQDKQYIINLDVSHINDDFELDKFINNFKTIFKKYDKKIRRIT